MSLKHWLTHFPKNPYCPAYNWARLRRMPTGIKRRGWRAATADKFGDVITCDRVIPYDANREDRLDKRTAFVIYDIGTKFIACHLRKDETAEQAEIAIGHFLGAQAVASLHSDGSGEIDLAARQLGVPHDDSAPGVHERDAIIERRSESAAEPVRCSIAQVCRLVSGRLLRASSVVR